MSQGQRQSPTKVWCRPNSQSDSKHLTLCSRTTTENETSLLQQFSRGENKNKIITPEETSHGKSKNAHTRFSDCRYFDQLSIVTTRKRQHLLYLENE